MNVNYATGEIVDAETMSTPTTMTARNPSRRGPARSKAQPCSRCRRPAVHRDAAGVCLMCRVES